MEYLSACLASVGQPCLSFSITGRASGPTTHPASPRAGEQASGDPQQVASAEASNVVQSKGPSQSQEIKQLWLVE